MMTLRDRPRLIQTVVIFAILAAAAIQLRVQGRLWACDCERIKLWVAEAWGTATSQHVFDPYSFTHVLHGILFCGALALLLPKLHWSWRLCLTIAGEALWEVIENTNFVIDRYREATAALGYTGDTIVNSLGDVICCGLGFVLARWLGLVRSVIFFVLIELLLLVWIRDSLLLNILMLTYPLDEIREWQTRK
jgi:hypothetical protein